MYTRIVSGMLIASGEARLRLSGVPLLVAPPPEYRFVPYCRVTPVRPGSIMNVTAPGVTPVTTCVIREASEVGTLNVSLPLPRLLIFKVTPPWPWLQLSLDRNTLVDSGCRIG